MLTSLHGWLLKQQLSQLVEVAALRLPVTLTTIPLTTVATVP